MVLPVRAVLAEAVGASKLACLTLVPVAGLRPFDAADGVQAGSRLIA